jgi:hypothetical protein
MIALEMPNLDPATFLGLDTHLPHITAESAKKALSGFALSLTAARDMDWLAMAVRRALAICDKSRLRNPKRTSNAEIRVELQRLAKLAEAFYLEFSRFDPETDSALWLHAARHWDGDLFVAGIDSSFGHTRMMEVIDEIKWIGLFLRDTADSVKTQRGPWKHSEQKRQRVKYGTHLAIVYEAAFGQPVSANNFPTDARIKAQTSFMDFYGRMVTLAFGKHETANLTEVVKAACQLHRQRPAEFAEGIIPGL